MLPFPLFPVYLLFIIWNSFQFNNFFYVWIYSCVLQDFCPFIFLFIYVYNFFKKGLNSNVEYCFLYCLWSNKLLFSKFDLFLIYQEQ